jgi:hypothetical protein
VDEQPGLGSEPSSVVVSNIVLAGAASLGIVSLVLAGVALYLVVRHQGFFYTAKVRATHVSDQESEHVDH